MPISAAVLWQGINNIEFPVYVRIIMTKVVQSQQHKTVDVVPSLYLFIIEASIIELCHN